MNETLTTDKATTGNAAARTAIIESLAENYEAFLDNETNISECEVKQGCVMELEGPAIFDELASIEGQSLRSLGNEVGWDMTAATAARSVAANRGWEVAGEDAEYEEMLTLVDSIPTREIAARADEMKRAAAAFDAAHKQVDRRDPALLAAAKDWGFDGEFCRRFFADEVGFRKMVTGEYRTSSNGVRWFVIEHGENSYVAVGRKATPDEMANRKG